MRKIIHLAALGAVLLLPASAGLARERDEDDAGAAGRPISRNILFPILVQSPFFGADVTLPRVDLPGGGSFVPAGSTETSFNAAAFAGLRLDRENWLLEVTGLYAGLSSERQLPRITVESDVTSGTATFGWRVFGDFLLTGGIRRMAVNLKATVEDFEPVERKPGVWDPLVGLTWRRDAGPKWTLEVDVDGGGFGVGSDVDVSGALKADWRLSNRFGLRFGYSFLYFKVTDTRAGRTLEVSQTLHGPSLGLGIYFGKQ
jgi:hypothetical protein